MAHTRYILDKQGYMHARTHILLRSTDCFSTATTIRKYVSVLVYTHIACLVINGIVKRYFCARSYSIQISSVLLNHGNVIWYTSTFDQLVASILVVEKNLIIIIEFCVVITADKTSGFASYQVPTDTEECP